MNPSVHLQLECWNREGEDMENKLMGAGQITGLVKTSASVKEIIDEIMVNFRITVERLQKMSAAFMAR
jgi:NAD(P)H-dependent flavin oxidoreductase YrpB (nitropropane dioxygenase family)